MSKHDVSRKILASLLVSPKYSDLTMVCHGQEFRVHRAVVCPQSPVLAAACDGNFEEANSRILAVTATDPTTLSRMLSYLYTGDYDHGVATAMENPDAGVKSISAPEKPAGRGSPVGDGKDIIQSVLKTQSTDSTDVAMINNSCVYAIADYYQIPELKALTAEKFAHTAESCSAEGIANIIKEVYQSTPDSDTVLRNHVCELSVNHSEALITDSEFMTRLSEEGEFAKDFLRALVKEHQEELLTQASETESADELAELRLEQLKAAISNKIKLEVKLERLNANMHTVRLEVNEARECRHCYSSCNVQLETAGPVDEPKLKVRCKICKTYYS